MHRVESPNTVVIFITVVNQLPPVDKRSKEKRVVKNYPAIFATSAFVLGIAATLASAQTSMTGVVTVQMKTNYGAVTMELDAARAPKTVDNFMKYVESGHYKGTVFHRVIDGFMVQGGGLDRDLKEKKTLPPIANEAGNGLKNDKYTLAMARKGDPNSATSQFFINVKDNGFLNRDQSQDGYGYTVFGRVVDGKEVVDKIAKAKTEAQQNPVFPAMLMQDVPVQPIVIEDIRVMKPTKQ